MTKLEEKEASAIKATIEIREIKIGDKQLDLALFEQLAFAKMSPNVFHGVPFSPSSPLGNVWGKVWVKTGQLPVQWYFISEWKGTLWRIRYLEILGDLTERKRNWERSVPREEGKILELNNLIEQAQDIFDSTPQIFLDK